MYIYIYIILMKNIASIRIPNQTLNKVQHQIHQWLDGLELVEAESVEDRTHLVFHTTRLQQVHKGHCRHLINLHKSSEPGEEPRSDTWWPTHTVEACIKCHQVMLLPDSTLEVHQSVSELSVGTTVVHSFVTSRTIATDTSGSTSEADGPTPESLQCSRPLAASCSSIRL